MDLLGPEARKLIAAWADLALSADPSPGGMPDLPSILLDRASAFHGTSTDPFEADSPAILRLKTLCLLQPSSAIHEENVRQANLKPGQGAAFAAWGIRILFWLEQERRFLGISLGSLGVSETDRIIQATLGAMIMTLIDGDAEGWARELSRFNQSRAAGLSLPARPSLLAIQSMCIRRASEIANLEDVEAAEEKARAAAVGVEMLRSSVA